MRITKLSAVSVGIVAVVTLAHGPDVVHAEESGKSSRPAGCIDPAEGIPDPVPPKKPTTVTTIGQAYHCIFDHYVQGPVLDSRDLLVPAFRAVTEELQRRQLDQPNATLPELRGKRDADWVAFAGVYGQIAAKLPDDAVRTAVAEAAIVGMTESLHDNHVRWVPDDRFVPNTAGMTLSGRQGPGGRDPAAVGPLHVTDVNPNGPAAAAGIKPGDEIVTVNGVPAFVNGEPVTGVLGWLSTPAIGTPVTITVHRPATGATLTVTLNPATVPGSPPSVEARLVETDIAYVRFPSFAIGNADKALATIAELRKTTQLRGVVLDLRSNGGGSPAEVARLAGALAHGKTINYSCDARDRCTPNRTDDSVELLNLPFVALTDRGCASACDAFSGAVKDLRLGTLVGTRTAGAVSGPARGYHLEDHSGLVMPELHQVSANKEFINTIGVAPDHYAPMTSADLSAGRDPGLDKAVSLL